MNLQPHTPVPITGAGCLTAAGPGLGACVGAMLRGERAHGLPSRITTDHKVAYPVFEIPWAYLPEESRRKPEHALYGDILLTAVREAFDNAVLSHDELGARTVGVCLGTTVGEALNDEDFLIDYREGRFPDGDRVRIFLNADPAAIVARTYAFAGPHQTITNACTSGTVAVGQAAGWIRDGLCDIVVAGGVEKLTRLSYDGFASLLIADTEPCRPFDRRRRGLNLGEGAGILILESPSSARARGITVRGSVLGYGNASDGYHLSAPKPDGAGLHRAITDALATAERTAGDVAFINAHGTGTADNDRVEGRVFAEVLPDVPYGSTKGFTGHTLGAAGGIEAAVTLACLQRQAIPGSAGFEESDPEFESDPVRTATAVSGNCALSTSVAYGGNNAVLLLGRWTA
jgi:3-oxoacyl-[acyl-carrier-protein] synthase II